MPLSLESTHEPGSGNASLPVSVHVIASGDVATDILLPLDEVAYAFQDPSPQIIEGSGN